MSQKRTLNDYFKGLEVVTKKSNLSKAQSHQTSGALEKREMQTDETNELTEGAQAMAYATELDESLAKRSQKSLQPERSDNLDSTLERSYAISSAAEGTRAASVSKESDASEDKTLLPEKPNHPHFSTIPPKELKRRLFRFQEKWFKEYPWLHFDHLNGSVSCFICRVAVLKKLVPQHVRSIKESDLVNGVGVKNWKKGSEKFSLHAKSPLHQDAILKVELSRKTIPVVTQLSKELDRNQKASRVALRALLGSIRYLARQGIPLRGHEEMNGNLCQLNTLRSGDIPELKEWLKRKRHLTSHDIQNEMAKLMAHTVLREVVLEIHQYKYYSLIVNETCDVSGKEQVSICVRVVKDFEPIELFLGLYETSSTTGNTLYNIIKDALTRFSLDISNLRGQCYDGAKNMSGIHEGVRTLLEKDQPLAFYLHCSNHSLNLALEDTVKGKHGIPLMRDALQYVNDVGVLIKASPKRRNRFTDIVAELSEEEGVTGMLKRGSPRPLCPTRWTVRVASLKGVLDNYPAILSFLEELANSNDDVSTKARGLYENLVKGSIYFGILICYVIFQRSEKLATLLQNPSISVSKAKESVDIILYDFGKMRSEYYFNSEWVKLQEALANMDLIEPSLPRVRKVPRRLEHTNKPTEGHLFKTPKDMLRATFFEGIEKFSGEIKNRFSQPGFERYCLLESILLNTPSEWTLEMTKALEELSNSTDSLKLELQLLPRLVKPTSLSMIVEKLKYMEKETRLIFPRTEELVNLLLVMPATSATAERSFSLLKRVKSYLRSTMTQKRLNHLCILHAYQEKLDNIDLDEIVKNFINTEERVIDTAQLFIYIDPDHPERVHVSPIIHINSEVIFSSVSSDAQIESYETLSFQGLSSSVWVLVGFSLLVVSGLATYVRFRTEKKNGRERPLKSWMNHVYIYAADIVNNCVAGVVRSRPGRHLRTWWLLGVVFLTQFWVAGMKSDLLIDKSAFIDTLEDLFSRPELILIMSKSYEDDNTFGDSEDDPRFKDYKKKNIRYVNDKYDEEWEMTLANGSGVILGTQQSALQYVEFRVKHLKRANRKQYVGKKRYDERPVHLFFNKRLPRAMKDEIDYLTSRIFETQQTEPNSRLQQFRSREFLFDQTDDSASTMSWSALSAGFLSPVFYLWITGLSLTTFVFCVEFYLLRRIPTKVSPHHSMGIRIRT